MHFTIPYSSIRKWAKDAGHPLDTLKRIIWTADKHYLGWVRGRQEIAAEQRQAERLRT